MGRHIWENLRGLAGTHGKDVIALPWQGQSAIGTKVHPSETDSMPKFSGLGSEVGAVVVKATRSRVQLGQFARSKSNETSCNLGLRTPVDHTTLE